MRRFVYIFILCLVTNAIGAQSVQDLQKQRDKALQQLGETSKMLGETKTQETATVNKLKLLGKDIAERKRVISNINSEITALNYEMDSLTAKHGKLQTQLDSLKQDYAMLVRQTHYADLALSPLLFLLSSDDFNQLVRRIRYMQEFSQYRREQVGRIKSVQEEIAIQNDLLEENRINKQEALNTQQKQKSELDKNERKQQSMLSELKKKEKKLLAQQKKQQAKANELEKKIEAAIAAETKKASKQTLTKEQQLIAGGFEANKGKLPWPTEKGFISDRFGTHPHPVLAYVTINNRGVNIQTTAGSMARAVYDGEVTACFPSGGTQVLILRHGNYYTVYANLSSVVVKVGDKVKTKQNLGKIYTDTENDNLTELQFQVRKEKDLLNPELWLAH